MKGGRNEQSRRPFGEAIWQLPFKSESLPGPIGDGGRIPRLVIKSAFSNGIHLLLPHYCCD